MNFPEWLLVAIDPTEWTSNWKILASESIWQFSVLTTELPDALKLELSYINNKPTYCQQILFMNEILLVMLEAIKLF